MKLISVKDPVFYTPPQPFDFNDPPIDPFQLADDLKQVMVDLKGIGLSANQVGLPYRVFAAGDYHDPDNIAVLFNPRIVFASDQTVPIEEGCLSYPGLFLIIDRPAIVRVRAADCTGSVNTNVYDGIPARVIQHEMDHMDGTNFTTKVTKLKLDRAKAHKKKLDKIRQRNQERFKQYG